MQRSIREKALRARNLATAEKCDGGQFIRSPGSQSPDVIQVSMFSFFFFSFALPKSKKKNSQARNTNFVEMECECNEIDSLERATRKEHIKIISLYFVFLETWSKLSKYSRS